MMLQLMKCVGLHADARMDRGGWWKYMHGPGTWRSSNQSFWKTIERTDTFVGRIVFLGTQCRAFLVFCVYQKVLERFMKRSYCPFGSVRYWGDACSFPSSLESTSCWNHGEITVSCLSMRLTKACLFVLEVVLCFVCAKTMHGNDEDVGPSLSLRPGRRWGAPDSKHIDFQSKLDSKFPANYCTISHSVIATDLKRYCERGS